MGYVDLHSHLLPGLDDGARTVADTLDFARRLDADGVRDIACTPHVKRASFPRVAPAVLAERRAAAQAAIDAAGLDVQLHPGGELAHPDALFLAPEQLALLAQGPQDARWMLLECPFRGIGADFLAAAARLDGLGYGLLLAHPERAAGMLCGGLDRLQPLLANGALLQVNVSSLLGRHGAEAQAIGATLVRRGLAYCLASDAHPGTREDTLRAGSLALLRTGADTARAVQLTDTNPRRLLEHGISRPAPAAPAAPAALLRAA
jgi:protein-tyrosine phosphatase